MRRTSLLIATSCAAATAALAAPAAGYCPSYTASSQYNDHSCGVEAAPGSNPSVAEWNDIFDLVSKGPAAWGTAGPAVGDIGQGCGKPEELHSVAARFPCELLKAIAMVESGWKQFCVPESPADQVGKSERTIISFDCGYGVGQVTSGMHEGEAPSFDRERVASDPTYNLATGTQILAAKWKATNCVGDNQPAIVEDWYTATWAYNGLAYSNNPNNPNLDPNRGVYDPSVGGSYAYQEKVFGRIENPPDAQHWNSVPLAYPNRSDCGDTGSPPDLPEPACASPTDCNNHRSTHVSSCLGTEPSQDAGTGGGGGSGGWAGAAGQPSDASSGHDAPAQGGSSGAQQDATTGDGAHTWTAPQEVSGCGCRTQSDAGAKGLWVVALCLLALVSRRA